MDTKVYVMTHRKISEIPEENYIPLHVGKKGKEDLGYIGDDTGDTISEKNPFYSELTGLYWIWKNVNCDIVGICHYRRFLGKEDKLLNKEYIEERIQKYPILVPNSITTNVENVYAHYALRHYSKDMDLCREVIAEKYPKYIAAFDYAMQTNLISMGNMWITYKEIFDRYCEWLFDILFEVEKRVDMTGYDEYQKRIMGFLSERLFRVWLFMQPEAIGEESIIQMEIEGLTAEEQKTEVLYRYVKSRIQPVLQLRQSGANGTLAAPFSCMDDFEGKIPVWVCWWQGEADMSEVVQCCIKSIKRNLPQEKTAFRLITLENCLQYVSFTDAVIRKFNEGKIPDKHLKDILKAELLYRYGGMWIDAECFVTQPLAEKMFKNDLCTLRVENWSVKADVTKGRWTSDLWICEKNSPLFAFLMDSLWYYWEMEERLVTGNLQDHIIAVAAEEIAEIRQLLQECKYSQEMIDVFYDIANTKHILKKTERLLKQAYFYKLDSEAGYRRENMAGQCTVYGYLLGI